MKRQTLDQMGPAEGARVRVFFPHGGGARVLVATGRVRDSSSTRCEHEHLMRDEVMRGEEWVPGWYVGAPVGRGGT
jgi:hypothetical protein